METEHKSESVPPRPPAESAVSAKSLRKLKRQRKINPPLVFIDTNIFLDFYRSQNDAGISLLSKIDDLHEQIIITCQVEMEFKKNRQKVISGSMLLLKPPEFNLATPAFLLEAKTVEKIQHHIRDVKKRVEGLKARIMSALENPQGKDRIYQTMQRLFNNGNKLNLRHETPEYKQIWRNAIRRFLEGRPPRKKDDTSAGDAINWEWIVRCIQQTNRDVIIVSRDADYGLTVDKKGYANNWLTEEVKERVSQQRKLILVDRLTTALKLLAVKVTPEEIQSERRTIASAADDLQSEMEDLIGHAAYDLVDSEEISGLLARTNAVGWGLDALETSNGRFENGKFVADVDFSVRGEQNEDKPWHGTKISGHCIAIVEKDKSVSFARIEAVLHDGSDEDGEAGAFSEILERPNDPDPEAS